MLVTRWRPTYLASSPSRATRGGGYGNSWRETRGEECEIASASVRGRENEITIVIRPSRAPRVSPSLDTN